jgi:hypothetical protein
LTTVVFSGWMPVSKVVSGLAYGISVMRSCTAPAFDGEKGGSARGRKMW